MYTRDLSVAPVAQLNDICDDLAATIKTLS